jgi:hypothetical protein
MVQVLGAPPILVTLEEAGLRVGTRSVVSEGGRPQSPPGVRLVGRVDEGRTRKAVATDQVGLLGLRWRSARRIGQRSVPKPCQLFKKAGVAKKRTKFACG